MRLLPVESKNNDETPKDADADDVEEKFQVQVTVDALQLAEQVPRSLTQTQVQLVMHACMHACPHS